MLERIPLFFALGTLLVAACSGDALKSPESDKNFDDPDNPNNPGDVVIPDASGDGNFRLDGSGQGCLKQEDCALPLRCIFPIALGCGSQGVCTFYTDPAGCQSRMACACDGTIVNLCAPDGYSPKPIGSCTTDAAPPQDATADAPTD